MLGVLRVLAPDIEDEAPDPATQFDRPSVLYGAAHDPALFHVRYAEIYPVHPPTLVDPVPNHNCFLSIGNNLSDCEGSAGLRPQFDGEKQVPFPAKTFVIRFARRSYGFCGDRILPKAAWLLDKTPL